MSQQLTDDFNIDPLTTSGTELASILNRLNSAVLSMQSGTSRPTYAVQGFKWLDVADTLNIEKFFTGSTDLSILEYDTVNNVAQINGGASFTDTSKAIKNKSSTTASAVPLPADLQPGELAINRADKKLYFKDSTGAVKSVTEGLATTASPALTGTPTVNGNAFNGLSGFKNGIINGAFEVNQYADIDTAPVALTTNYQIDRYDGFINTVTATIQRLTGQLVNNKKVNTLKLTATSTGTGYFGVVQKIELIYNYQTKTLGAWVKSNKAGVKIAIYDDISGYVFSSGHTGGGTFEFLSISNTVPATATALMAYIGIYSEPFGTISITSGDYIEFTMLQLEDGSIATNFEQRPVGLELELCQRYYEVKYRGGGNSLHYSASTANAFVEPFVYKVPKRVVPTVTFSTPTYNNCSGLASVSQSVDHAIMRLTVTATGSYDISSYYIYADAEL